MTAAMSSLKAIAAKPVRLQRSRRKGARLVSPNGLPVICVTRGSSGWGNPFRVGEYAKIGARLGSGSFSYLITNANFADASYTLIKDAATAVELYREYLQRYPKDLSELRGCNLACWCKVGDACHADILLELANG